MADVIGGTTPDGEDFEAGDFEADVLAELRRRQEAIWAVLVQGYQTVDYGDRSDEYDHHWMGPNAIAFYLPRDAKGFDCWAWYAERSRTVEETVGAAVRALDPYCVVDFQEVLDVPEALLDFVAGNTDRPKPRRYNSTAVTYIERDGVAWLTPPEVKLYDAIKEAGWLFIPQPQFLAGDRMDRRPDFLIYWRRRAENAVLVEVDSDAFHPPSQREKDEEKERLFQALGFHYLRFSAKRVLDDPFSVVAEITKFCTTKFGE